MNTFANLLEKTKEIGFTTRSLESMAYVSGLPGLKPGELVQFETGEVGQAAYIEEDDAEILVFAKLPIKIGTRVTRTTEVTTLPVGAEYLGQLIDPFGNLLDKLRPFKLPEEKRPIDVEPAGIAMRRKITKSLETGVSLVDMLIPLGQGQRELVIGDRKTGKTNFLLQTIYTQARKGVICIYAAIGKKKFDVKQAEEYFRKKEIMDQVVIMAALADDPLSTIYISPFAAMTLAEYFKDRGNDVLIVMDDLNTHAKFYREISLLGKRFPGRNAYPADIFYTHAKLLERAGNFGQKNGVTAITCLPVVETVQGDITGYIQTNLMSMTDGHIYFDVDLFAKGRRPAVNPFLSVTRVGRQTQNNLRRTINRELTSFLTLRERIENFAHFGAETSTTVKNTLLTGDQITAFFDQTSEVVLEINLQIFLFALIWFGIWRTKTPDQLKQDLTNIIIAFETKTEFQKAVAKTVEKQESLNTLLTEIGKSGTKILRDAGIKV
ncbi:MAG: F0F1 ATP synthase subunit alpha [bacterium]|nr:F0F1 ATP synthase subunit alpha [bacterium]